MICRACATAFAAIVGLAFVVPAVAVETTFAGSQPTISSGAGQTTSRGPSAVFYNPANLIMSKFIEPDLVVGYASTSYSYLHTDADTFPDAAVVKQSSPVITAGAAFRPIEGLAFGVAYLAKDLGAAQEIPDVPMEMTLGTYEPVFVQTKTTASKLAVGAAFRFAFPFALGAGLIRTQETRQTLIFRESDADLPSIDALYGGAFNQFVVGARSELLDRFLVLAFSYRTAVTKAYTGTIAHNANGVEADYEDFLGVGYSPSAIGVGAETRIASFGLYGEVLIEQWSAGRQHYRRGLLVDEPLETDLKDTTNFGGGVKFWVAPEHMLQLSFAMYSANVGDGIRADAATLRATTQDGTGARDADVAGIGFGELEAIPRFVAGGGYRMKLEGAGYLQLGGSYQTGKREVPEGFDGEGSYSLSVLTASLGLAYGF